MTIPNTILYNPAPQFTDDDGNPLDRGQLQIFEANTNVLKDIFADNTQNTPILNPVELGVGGFTVGGVWIPEGNYDLSIEKYIGDDEFGDPEFERVRFRENIAGAGGVSGGSGVGVSSVDSIDELRSVLPDTADLLYVAGYYGLGTSGGGFFSWDSTATANDDGGYIIAPDGGPANGRWFRAFSSTDITMEMWGSQSGIEYTNASNVENMITFAKNNLSYRCVLNTGEWYLNGNVLFDGDISVFIKEDCLFTGLTGVHTLTFSCTYLEVESRSTIATSIPSSLQSLTITSDIQVLPQWWGAIEGFDDDSTDYFANCVSKSGSNDIIIDSEFAINGVDFTGHKVINSGNGALQIGTLGATFDAIESEGEFISGGLTSLTFNESDIIGNWFRFFDGSVDNVKWKALMVSLASNGQKTIYWNYGVVGFVESLVRIPELNNVRFNIGPNCKFKATGAITVAMPRVVSKSHCFDNSSTGLFNFVSNVLASQFGAVSGDGNSFSSAMRYGLQCNAPIDLDGEEYEANNTLNGSLLSFGDVSLLNGKITVTSGLSADYLFELDGNVSFKDVFIDSTAVSNIDVLSISSGSKTISIVGGGMTSQVTNNFIFDSGTSNSILISGGAYDDGLFRFDTNPKSMIVSNNIFNDCHFAFYDYNNTTITSNTFIVSTDSHVIDLYGATSSQRNGIVIKNNNYIGLSRNYFVRLNAFSGYDTNYPISIEDNTGTDISTTYTFTHECDLTLGDQTVFVYTYLNTTAISNGNLFEMNSYLSGLEAIDGIGGIWRVGCDSINPVTVANAALRINAEISVGQTTQIIYSTLKRAF